MMQPVRVPDRMAGADQHAHDDPAPVTPAPVEELPRLSGIAELFHQLNNQLGIILANAELLELKAKDDTSRARAAQVVTSVLEALTTARNLRQHLED